MEHTKYLQEKQTGQTLLRLLLQKQSDQGLPYLSRLSWQATAVQNFRTFIIQRMVFRHSIILPILQYLYAKYFSDCSLWKTHEMMAECTGSVGRALDWGLKSC